MKKNIYFQLSLICFSGIFAGIVLAGNLSCTNNVNSEAIGTLLQDTTNFTGKKIKNIILMIGDGMGISQVTAGMVARRDALNLERCRVIGLSKTNSSDDLITDSAAGATAFSIGKKTYNGAIGVDRDTVPAPTILEIAEKNGLSTGLVATVSITHATPASFIAHQPSRLMDEEIAADFIDTDIDVFIGGGKIFFENRSDGRNLLEELKKNGYNVANGIENIMSFKQGKLAGFIADKHPVRMSEGRSDVLAKAAGIAIGILDQNDKGFFLMIEGSQIDWGGHANDSEYIIEEMLDFDQAIGKALDFAAEDGETLVIITADHECGGYAIAGGNIDDGTVQGSFTTNYHTGVMVPVFAYGPGAEAFAGVYHNNTIFDKMMKAFRFEIGD
ncbi:MAG: alkaline phosphatase [Bacteroidota bacterium]